MRSAFFARIVLIAACFAAYTVELFSRSQDTSPVIIMSVLIVLPPVVRYYLGTFRERRVNKTVRHHAVRAAADSRDETLISGRHHDQCPKEDALWTVTTQYRYSFPRSSGDHAGILSAGIFIVLWQYSRCSNIGYAIECLRYYGGVKEWLLVLPVLSLTCGAVAYAVAFGIVFVKIRKTLSEGGI